MGYIDHVLIIICIYSILSVSLNLIIGFTGILSLGHAAFFGIGAYASALLALAGCPFFISFLGASILAGIFGLLIGMPSLRLRGDYLAIATLGFGEIIRSIMKNWSSVTRGPLGLPGIPYASFFIEFDTPLKFLFLALVSAAVVVGIIFLLVHSPFGRVLRAIREDEIAAQAIGKNVRKYKLAALMIGAFFAGAAGSLYAHYITFIDPTTFTFIESIVIVCMVVLGGMASIPGSVLGAIIIVLLPEPLRFLHLPADMVAALRQMLYAIILILLMLLRPQGIFGEKKYKAHESS